MPGPLGVLPLVADVVRDFAVARQHIAFIQPFSQIQVSAAFAAKGAIGLNGGFAALRAFGRRFTHKLS